MKYHTKFDPAKLNLLKCYIFLSLECIFSLVLVEFINTFWDNYLGEFFGIKFLFQINRKETLKKIKSNSEKLNLYFLEIVNIKK